MSNLIQYIVQEDPEEELKKKQSQTLLSRELSSQEDTDKNYKFNSRHLLENDFSHLQSKPAPTARSYLSQALAKNVVKEGSKVSSALSPKSIGNDAASYKIAQNTKGNEVNDVAKRVTFNDVYWGCGSRTNTHQIEGGYNNRANDRGGPTNFAVTQNTLNEYNNWKSSLRTGFNFPKDVKDLKPEQARQILDERFYQAYNIKAIQNAMIARNVFDAEINQGTRAGKWLAEIANEYFGTNYPQNMVISPQLAEKINQLPEPDAIKINNAYIKKRMKEYLNLIDKDHSQINNIKSWYNRAKNLYSNPEEFDKLYQSTLDEYLNRKYSQYYDRK